MADFIVNDYIIPDADGQERMADGAYPFANHFWKTKKYLHRIRDWQRRCGLLEQRIDLREDGDTDTLDQELREAEQMVNGVKIEVTDMIAKLPDVNQQLVMTERYVNLKTWERIAEEMNTSVRIVQKIHGKALPVLEELIGASASTGRFSFSDSK